ncbi:leucine-rich repeat domain-containing protein [Pseudomonas rubra]|uniref:Leucine-rich repeat domain-containing protein n=1 Tax=Pseudomonas rubra TaxID=2942627 RepID=A0ABT5PE16_9PSED|nr:leucine-rich repeat domain-containing protein [Pseudomonas rubra]MDD1016435.1 leucine-rich repeat domain-containing protein [Pseudomonas rubra]MDD1036564.1 leucine-rich repeat domain-containing protein [Pseudomonas rubra]MDD1156524.1 leucine-rich repeat domain-containing protein [Pseudomonas rubra]
MADPHYPLHVPFLRQRLPNWVRHAHPEQLASLHLGLLPAQEPAWLQRATPAQRQKLNTLASAAERSRHEAAVALRGLKDIHGFCRPLLEDAIKRSHGLTVDSLKHEFIHLRDDASLRVDALSEVLIARQPLLQAALQNFEMEQMHKLRFNRYSQLTPLDALQPFPATVDPQRRASDSIHYSSTLALTPAQFASLCRSLDLGAGYQDHLTAVFEGPSSGPLIRRTYARAHKAELQLQLNLAQLRGDIDADLHERLERLLQQPTVEAGPSLSISRLALAGFALADVLLFCESVAGGAIERCVAYIPGDRQTQLKQYPSRRAFAQAFKARLADPKDQSFIRSFVARSQQARFSHAISLAAALLGSDALVEHPVTGDVFDASFKLMLATTRTEARAIAVPTAEVDYQAWLTSLEQYAAFGLNVLNAAAFFVPALGPIMLTIMASQLMTDAFEGVQAWEAGDKDEALAHLKSIALNLVVTAGLGAATIGVSRLISASPVVDRLVEVERADGQRRLWQQDLEPYRSVDDLPAGLVADTSGVYRHAGRSYVKESGHYYALVDEQARLWRLQHSTQDEAYQPPLQHNGQGAWHSPHEQPLRWSRRQLMRRLGHSVEALSDDELQQACELTGTDGDALRRMHVDGEPVDPLLADSCERTLIRKQIGQVIEAIRSGTRSTLDMDVVAALLPDIPGWPEGQPLELFQGPEPWGSSVIYGERPGFAATSIKLTRAELRSGEWARIVIEQLDRRALTRLFSEQLAPSGRIEALRNQVAEHVSRRRAAVFTSRYRDAGAPSPLLDELRRRFKTIDAPLARRLIEQLPEAAMDQWSERQRFPQRLERQARRVEAERPLVRRLEGIVWPELADLQSESLVFDVLPELAGWSSEVCLQLRVGSLRGVEVMRVGNGQGTVQRVIVREGEGYRAYANDQSLHSLFAERTRNDIFRAILHALPDVQRRALGLSTGDAEAFKVRLLHRISGLRRRWVPSTDKPPRGRLRGGGDGTFEPGYATQNSEDVLIQRLREMFPELNDEQVLETLEEWGELGRQPADMLAAFQQALEVRQQALQQWAGGIEGRQQLSSEVLAQWRRTRLSRFVPDNQDRELNLLGLGLTGADLSSFPDLQWDLGRVTVLSLGNNRLESLPASFTKHFPGVKYLYLDWNLLEAIPTVPNEQQLRVLDMSGNELQQSPDISRLFNLRRLMLDNCGLTAIPENLANLQRATLIDLRWNSIAHVDENAFELPDRIKRALDLRENPLDEDSKSRIDNHYGEHQIDLLISDHYYQFLLSDANQAQRELWQRLRHIPECLQTLRNVLELELTSVYAHAQATTLRRAWDILEMLERDPSLRAPAAEQSYLLSIEGQAQLSRANQVALGLPRACELLRLAVRRSRLEHIGVRFDATFPDQLMAVEGGEGDEYEALWEHLLHAVTRDGTLDIPQAPRDGEFLEPLTGQQLPAGFVEALKAELVGLSATTTQGLESVLGSVVDESLEGRHFRHDFWVEYALGRADSPRQVWNEGRRQLQEQAQSGQINGEVWYLRLRELQVQYQASLQRWLRQMTYVVASGQQFEW